MRHGRHNQSRQSPQALTNVGGVSTLRRFAILGIGIATAEGGSASTRNDAKPPVFQPCWGHLQVPARSWQRKALCNRGAFAGMQACRSLVYSGRMTHVLYCQKPSLDYSAHILEGAIGHSVRCLYHLLTEAIPRAGLWLSHTTCTLRQSDLSLLNELQRSRLGIGYCRIRNDTGSLETLPRCGMAAYGLYRLFQGKEL